MSCPHLSSLDLQPPRYNQSVQKDECSQCFDSQAGPDGVDVCLSCFQGGCPRLHAQAHADKLGDRHAVVLNIRRTRKPKADASVGEDTSASKRDSGEPPSKRLAIREEVPEHEKYDFHTKLKCYACGGVDISGNEKSDAVVAAVLSSMSSAQQNEVKAWEEEIAACRHSKELVQEASKKLEQSGLAHCSACDLNQNLWLCLTCGSLSCGRKQVGGLPGNGHALAHFDATSHPVSVKLGTIEPDGSADLYCYACNDAVLDPALGQHLATFGISVGTQKKTEKSMTELQVEQNLNFDFAMTGEDGKELEPLFGPGLTGLSNLGNSCYMASVLQTLFSLPQFADRYFTKGSAHSLLCTNPNPASCFGCQISKIGDGLLSGRYAVPRGADSALHDDATRDAFLPPTSAGAAEESKPRQDPPSKPFQEGLKPSAFKALVGKDHPEFKTMRQQDAEEFFKHLIGLVQKESRGAAAAGGTMLDDEGKLDPTDTFKFELEEKLQCNDCKGVRYKNVAEETLSIPVPFIEKKQVSSEAGEAMDIDSKGKNAVEGPNAQPEQSSSTPASTATGAAEKKESGKTEWESVKLEECISLLTNTATIEYKCPRCDKNVYAKKSTKFASFPDTLVVHAQRFRLHNWVPEKVDVPIILPSGPLSLDSYLGTGKLPEETELPEDTSAAAAPEVQFDAAAMAQLEGMGFPTVRCQKALLATGNQSPEAAMEWLFQHMEDPDIDAPLPPTASAPAAGASEPSADTISMVAEMGFTPAQARKALRETGGSVEAAVEWLFSHPEDQGDDGATTSADAPASSSTIQQRGSREVPAQYKLKAFISHRGPSVHSGHYIAHVHHDDVGWVLFNDEKVVKADGGAQAADGLMPYAYLYFFEKISPVPA